jgi:hypothetical protein
MADLTFYSSIRQGAALAITRQDADPNAQPAAHVQLPVSLSYDAETALTGTPAQTTLSLLGPGDIVGLDTRTIVRTFPVANDNEAEAGFLCYVDFDQVDLPWRYTPAANAGAINQKTDRLRPWLTLVVLEEGVQFNPASDFRPAKGDEKLPQLTVAQFSYLPDPTNLWAWAHVQSQQLFSDAALPGVISGPPGQLVARLLSPRQLDPNKAYTAFLVPTFAAGVAAGQGTDPGQTDGLKAAWDANNTPFPIQLPVYFSWRFQTGTVSSFSQAVSELKPFAELPATVGVRAMDVSSPGLTLPSATGATGAPMSMGGALQTPEQAQIADPALDTNWVKALGALEDPAKQTTLEVLPPLYGRWYAVQDHLDYPGGPATTNPPWFSLLNQDPRYRVAGGLGTEVVERDQQAIMAAAQEQAAVLNTVNRRRKILQTGREVFTNMVTRHLNTGPAAVNSIFLVTAVLHGKIISCGGGSAPPTIRGVVDGSPFGGWVFPWRRIFPHPAGPLIGAIGGGGFIPGAPATPSGMSTPSTTLGGDAPGGLPDGGITTIINTMTSDQRLYWGVVIFWVARKLLSTQAGKYWWLLRRLLRLGLDLIQLASTTGVTSVTVLEKLRAGTLLGGDIQNLPQLNNFTSVTENPQPVLSDPTTWPQPLTPPTGTPKDDAQAQAFRSAAIDLFNFVNGSPLPSPTIPKVDVGSLVSCILSALSPSVTFVEYEKAIHVQTKTITWQGADPLEPILLPPTVSFPMWSRLAAISPDWILPNVGDVPRNSVSLVETNQEFIEAFMVGLNHQVNRELLWNGYPTDQRGTIFQQFWDPSGWTDGTTTGRPSTAFMDITEIRGWGATSALGTHTQRVPNVNHLVLLVRGDVIKRYPNVVVYASKAVIKDPNQPNVISIDDTQQMYPVFQAVLTGDVAYYGFELTEDTARGTSGDPGWFFILQEHPHEPKFNTPGQPLANPPNAGPGDYAPQNNGSMPTAAVLAATAYETTTRAAILGRDLLP